MGTGAWLRGVAHMRAVRRVPWWETAVSTLSGGILLLLAAIAPKLGVALVAVGLVCGQSVGGLLADRIGLTTGGRRPASPIRLCAGALAIAAVTLGALGAGHGVRIGLLALGRSRPASASRRSSPAWAASPRPPRSRWSPRS